ncbi:DMT family transporter [Frankia sp. AgB1.9]|uniref:DMT family transporter n=1 Tax=unclassified Frankia TaxID=2632575 RepID=UPI0019342AC7|nr:MULTISPECIES: DMT family transporter [unclassified Frankia]MBL7489935.1 DMT family transporter [Frankia sp. AgW1.1]MBL7552666.1 DMT family transporter [Frankia sp. AgB1.9]MBL7623831.1 DMT family transporter [Frankia sp. AgB1.8]
MARADLASGGGAAFGVTSALVRVVATRLCAAGAERALTGWAAVVLVAAALTGLALSQQAYRAGSLGAALPALTIVDPVVAIGVGELLLGEPVSVSGTGGIAAAACGLVVVAGTVRLASLQAPPV